jgi:hypothetical protein
MSTGTRYSDYIHLNTAFKDVFSFDSDIDEESLWKRFIFTRSYKELVEHISFIFSNERANERKGILLTGRYGVGKSHATGVLSHLLWDDFSTIQDMLTKAKRDMEETGSALYQFRENNRYFPVILTGRDSGEVSDAKSFEYRLQIALERSLKKYGYSDQISEKTEFEKYSLWLQGLVADPKREEYLNLMENHIKQNSDFLSADELIDALNNSDIEAIRTISGFFNELDVPAPRHCDTSGYYDAVLAQLKKIDPSIVGIVIYWDEFTTVFSTAGKNNDANLLGLIQTWAEKASSNIYLFLISHQSPEALRGKYKVLEDSLAKISDRFVVADIRMDKITTYHLIAESLQVSNRSEFSSFLSTLGFTTKEYNHISTICGQVFGEIYYRDEQVIKRTIPLHLYSVYVAGKFADLIGSAERSIFQLIHSKADSQTPFGQKLGFARFLEQEPSNGSMSWYTIDQVFDFFYDDLSEYEFDSLTEANVVKPLNAFTHYYEVAKNMGDDALKVFKTVVLMEMLNAKTQDPVLLPTKKNISNALVMTGITNVDDLLTRLVEKPILLAYDDERTGSIIFKTRYGGYDDEELEKAKQDLLKNSSFEKFLEHNQVNIFKKIKEALLDEPRIANGHADITIWSGAEFTKKKQKIKELDASSKLNLIVVIPEKLADYDFARNELNSLSSIHKNIIFALYEGGYRKRYEKWISACALQVLGQKRANRSIMDEAKRQIESEDNKLLSDLVRLSLFFRGATVTKADGFGTEIGPYISQIYNRGFDSLKYAEFWKSPKINGREILDSYGKITGRKNFEEHKTYYVKKIMELFRDNRDNILVDPKLLLKENEGYTQSSSLYEIVTKIRQYVMKHNGNWISLRVMIDALELERPPYGLCGWMESLIIAYALAEFASESRLEVLSGNQTASKDATKIIEAINDVIKNKNSNRKIRYGSIVENKLAKKLREMFALEGEVKATLPEVTFKIRERINSIYGLPLWTIPYAYPEPQRQALRDLVNSLNGLLLETNTEKELSESQIESILEMIQEIEYQEKKSIWDQCFSHQAVSEGMKAYLHLHYPRLLLSYPSVESLTQALKNEVKEDIWTWQEQRIADVLALLNRSTEPPEAPQNVHSSLQPEGVVIVWDMPQSDTPLPTFYHIERGESTDSFQLLSKKIAESTRFCDSGATPGKMYYYRIIAENPAGKSEPSTEVKQKILPPPPQLPLRIHSEEEYIIVSWEIPDSTYEIKYYELSRGESPRDFNHSEQIPYNINSHQDFGVEQGKKYYYRIFAVNSAGQKGQGSMSAPAKLLVTTPPPPPQRAFVVSEKDRIRVAWSHPENERDSVEEYCVYRNDGSGAASIVYSGPSEDTTWFDQKIQPGIMYSYTISSRNKVGESTCVSAGSIKILPEIPPIKLSVVDNGGYAHITWELLGDEYAIQKYEVRRGDQPGNLKVLKVFNSRENSFTDDSVRPGRIYYYDLVVRNSEDAHRESGEAISFTPSVSIDIHAWEGTTKTFIETNSKLFITSLRGVVSAITDNGRLGGHEAEDKKLIIKVKNFLEELTDE